MHRTAQPVRSQEMGMQSHDQKSFRPGAAHNEFAQEIWVKSDQRFVSICMATVQPIRDQETNGNVAKSYSGQGRSIMSWSTKFQPNSIISLSENLPRLFDQPEVRKQKEFHGARPNINHAWPGLEVGLANLNPFISANGRKLFSQSENRIQQRISGAWSNVIQVGGALIESVHHIWAQSDQPFVRKCTETDWPIRCQNTTGIQWSMTKN